MVFSSFKQKIIFFHIPVILFSLLPIFLITGPFLSDFSISLIGLLYLAYCVKEKNFSLFNNRYFYFFLTFWIYLVINSLLLNFNLDSLGTSFVYVRYGIFVIAIVALLNFDSSFIKYFFYCIFASFTVLILDGFYQYFNGANILGFTTANDYRVASFFNDEQILGNYLSRLWPIFFGLSIFIFQPKNKLFSIFILIFILSEALIFLSGDRTAFFYINLSALFVILFSQKLAKLRLFTLISSILLIIIISYINPSAKERVIDHTLIQMNLLGDTNSNEDIEEKQIFIFTKSHHQIYTAAYKMFMDNKIIGVGIKNFRIECRNTKYYVDQIEVCSTHPHNTYLQLLSETGIIGFFFLLVVLIYFLKTLIRHLKYKLSNKYYFSDFEICILSGIIIYLWPFAPTLNVFNNWMNIALIINLPFLLWIRGQTDEGKYN
tara:strand:- start:1255 stop:2553 length:1299 start_codon:yes stop_codon:yes gene_type:complete